MKKILLTASITLFLSTTSHLDASVFDKIMDPFVNKLWGGKFEYK